MDCQNRKPFDNTRSQETDIAEFSMTTGDPGRKSSIEENQTVGKSKGDNPCTDSVSVSEGMSGAENSPEIEKAARLSESDGSENCIPLCSDLNLQNSDVKSNGETETDLEVLVRVERDYLRRERVAREWLLLHAPSFNDSPKGLEDKCSVWRDSILELIARRLRQFGLNEIDARQNMAAFWGDINGVDYPVICAVVKAEYAETQTSSGRPESATDDAARGVPTQRVWSLTDMLDGCVFIADGSRVALIDNPSVVYAMPDFKNAVAGSFEKVGDKASRVVDMWLRHDLRKTVATVTFAPGELPICKCPRNKTALNLWRRRERLQPANYAALIESFLAHIVYLVPDAAERERFLDWLAHIEQKPGELPSTSYLMTTPTTGTGRNWLANALGKVWPGHVALGWKLGQTLRSGFNGNLSCSLLAVADEVREGGAGHSLEQRSIAEALKSMLTETVRTINPKFGRQHEEFNCCRTLMFSNHGDSLPLSDNDRRVIVLANPVARMSSDYYAALYALLDDPGLGDALGVWFGLRDISGFNAGDVAPMNAAKARTIRAGRSEIEQAIRDIAAEWPSDCITGTQLIWELQTATGERLRNTQGFSVAAGLVKVDKRVKIDGKSQNVWALRNLEYWRHAESADIAAEVTRGHAETVAPPPDKPKTTGDVFN